MNRGGGQELHRPRLAKRESGAAWRLSTGGGGERFQYVLADGAMYSDLPLPLSSMGVREGWRGNATAAGNDGPLGGAMTYDGPLGGAMTYDGPAWLGQSLRRVRCVASAAGFDLMIEGLTPHVLSVDLSRRLVRAPSAAMRSATRELVLEALLGPCLVLALASDDVFCLHASGALTPAGSAVLFCGASGAGKSTLAAGLGFAWQRFADDIVPWSLTPPSPSGAMATLWPSFPQLKLDAEERQALAVAPVELCAVFFLGEDLDDAVAVSDLGPSDAASRLLRHSVASRLFPPSLLEAHFAASAELAGRVPCFGLDYPRRLDALARVAASIETAIA